MKADNDSVTRLIKTARGQMDGVLRMIEKDTYCMDVLNQLLAAQAVLSRKSSAPICSVAYQRPFPQAMKRCVKKK